eukprot:TRINITY_DN2665_c0_g1_i3.p1 TRINITY_DN2665_c0_g1~~TRINITY_DN2665_c0_g1_i3.p1  ORF type:complete len:352 (+),score=61.33 TRINITY_DN2665_c0_g1_i3:52-1107(+)
MTSSDGPLNQIASCASNFCIYLFKFSFLIGNFLVAVSTVPYDAPPEWFAAPSPIVSPSPATPPPQLFDVYIINLNASSLRYTRIEAHLRSKNIQFQRLQATNGLTANLSHRIHPFCRHFCLPTTMGCFDSHYRVWQDFMHSNYSFAVVLEDDAVVHPDFVARIHALMAEAEAAETDSRVVWTNLMCMAGYLCDVTREGHLRRAVVTPTTTGYLLSRSSAAKLVARFPITYTHLDVQMTGWSWGQNAKLYSSSEMLVRQDGSHSTISPLMTYPPLLSQFYSYFVPMPVYWETAVISILQSLHLNGPFLTYFFALGFASLRRPVLLLMAIEMLYYTGYWPTGLLSSSTDSREL